MPVDLPLMPPDAFLQVTYTNFTTVADSGAYKGKVVGESKCAVQMPQRS